MSIDTNSTSLREFSLKVTNSRGDNFHIEYGYDLNIKTAGYYVRASINGSPMSSSKKVLSRVRNLKIDAINELISLIGSDHTGVPYEYETQGKALIESHVISPSDKTYNDLVAFYRADDTHRQRKLNDLIEKYAKALKELASNKSLTGYIRRFHTSGRISYLNDVRSAVQAIRKLYLSGCEVNGTKYLPTFIGYLKNTHYPMYYKRDIDYVRKARVNIYTNILKKEYVPYIED